MTSTIFIFASLHFLVHNKDTCATFTNAITRGTISLVVVSEVHVLVQVGTTFQGKISDLQDIFF